MESNLLLYYLYIFLFINLLLSHDSANNKSFIVQISHIFILKSPLPIKDSWPNPTESDQIQPNPTKSDRNPTKSDWSDSAVFGRSPLWGGGLVNLHSHVINKLMQDCLCNMGYIFPNMISKTFIFGIKWFPVVSCKSRNNSGQHLLDPYPNSLVFWNNFRVVPFLDGAKLKECLIVHIKNTYNSMLSSSDITHSNIRILNV